MIAQTRSDFMATVVVNGTQCKDMVSVNWDKLIIKRATSFYRVVEGDIGRPDSIALKVYGNMNYWWVLMWYNHINDVWNDLVNNTLLTCPNQLDIQDFFGNQ